MNEFVLLLYIEKIEMRLLIIVSFFIFHTVLLLAQDTPGNTFGGPFNDIGYSICNTHDGGFILAGTTRNSDTSNEDIYIIKIDKNGHKIWDVKYGWPHTDVIRSVIPLSDGYLFAGEIWDYGLYDSDIYLLKTDLFGNKIWDNLYGTNSREIGFKAISFASGGYLLLGHTRGYENAGDIILIKTNEAGDEIWRNTFGSEFDDYGLDLIQNTNGTIWIVGTKGGFFNDVHANFKNHDADIYLIKVDETGNVIWEKTIGGSEHDFGYSIIQSQQNDIYIFGSSQSYGSGSFDMLLCKTDENGETIWQKTYGGVNYEYGQSIAVNAQRELFLLGTTSSFGINNSPDIYLVKTDETGDEKWSLTIGGSETEFGYQVVATPDSGCMIIGETNSFGAGFSDFLITKVDKNGIIEYFIDSIEVTHEEEMLIYPIPVHQQGRIRFKNNTVSDFNMMLISLSGQHIKSIHIYQPDYNFNVSTMRPGLYFYQITSTDNSKILFKGKLVIR